LLFRGSAPFTLIESEPNDSDEVAVDRGQVDQLLAGDVAADLLRREVHERRLGRHVDGLFERPDLQRDVNRGGLADLEPDVLARVLLEPLKPRADLVDARHQAAHEVRAVGGADGLAEHAGVLVLDRDGNAREHRSLRVDHAAAHLRDPLLRRGGAGGKQDHDDPAQYTMLHHTSSFVFQQ
jgi:hypothetical protein